MEQLEHYRGDAPEKAGAELTFEDIGQSRHFDEGVFSFTLWVDQCRIRREHQVGTN